MNPITCSAAGRAANTSAPAATAGRALAKKRTSTGQPGEFGRVLDILKLILKPSGAYFPGFTLSAVLGGLIYGFAFYRKPVSVKRVFVANLIVKVFDNIILNSLWLHIMYGKALAALLPARIVSNAVMLPIDTALFCLILKAADRTIRKEFSKENIKI